MQPLGSSSINDMGRNHRRITAGGKAGTVGLITGARRMAAVMGAGRLFMGAGCRRGYGRQ